MKKLLEEKKSGRILEEKKDESGKISFPSVIISQGLGNLADRNYYTAEAVQSGVAVYEGKKCYFDHPTRTQSEEQPGRSVKETAGHYENCKAVMGPDGLLELRADFVPEKQNDDLIGKIKHAIEYKKKYPDKDYIGISINGDGEGQTLPYDDFIKQAKPKASEMEKIKQVEGQDINMIMKLTDAVSADLVTEPGAKGRILMESNKLLIKKRRTKMIEAMKKFLFGAEKQDRGLLEEAVKDMLQSEGGEDEAKAKEDAAAMEAAMEAEADTMVKGMLQWKKENEKYEKESEAEYEARCMKQCMKQARAEKAEKEKKEAAAAAEAAGKEGAPPPQKGGGAPAPEAEKESADHPDEPQDKALMTKMMKKHDDMAKEIESLKKEMEKSKKESEKHHEESAKAHIALKSKERAEDVDRLLRESGLPRYATDELRALFLDKVRSKEEMKKIVETAKDVHFKALESAYLGISSTGFTEISTSDKETSTDHLFT